MESRRRSSHKQKLKSAQKMERIRLSIIKKKISQIKKTQMIILSSLLAHATLKYINCLDPSLFDSLYPDSLT
jgi:hypothetical protein